ncbi:AAA family ATPase [Paraglaciecola mesophila]|uniref:AAA family ATPase n=1 Tax=Paraglaciecola mesophila TaxID=197222 RepID=A0ABU9SZV1_9ALTE
MTTDKITLKNIKSISNLSVEFVFTDSNFLVVTGKNGLGKTSVVKAFHLLKEPQIFEKSAGLNAVSKNSEISFTIDGFEPFTFSANNPKIVLDSRNKLPSFEDVVAELPIPYGKRFEQFSLVASHDNEIRNSIAATQYEDANDVISFLSEVYLSDKFSELKEISIGKNVFYIILKHEDNYVREDHFSSGEFFLIQLYRLLTSGAKLVLVDELDVALDAAAQVRLYTAIKTLLKQYQTRLIVVSHSLAFMSTVDDDSLYYLEENEGQVTLEQRSFGYVKSDLYGFKGFDRYILTEDPVLEGFIEFIIIKYSITPFYQHKTIGVGGVNQLRMLVEKNDHEQIFTTPENIMAIADRDVISELSTGYDGGAKIFCSPVEDLELFIFNHRDTLLTEVELPTYQESTKSKKASKSYWKYLTVDKGIVANKLYELIVNNNQVEAQQFAGQIQSFLIMD